MRLVGFKGRQHGRLLGLVHELDIAHTTQLQSEVDGIAGQTCYNGTNVLDGHQVVNGMNVQVGADAGQGIIVTIGCAAQGDLGLSSLDIPSRKEHKQHQPLLMIL